MELTIKSIDLEQPALSPIVDEIAKAFNEGKQLYQKREELPRYMTKKQAAEYLNVSYNTMMSKFVPNGLKVIIVDGMTRIDKKDCDEFLEGFKK